MMCLWYEPASLEHCAPFVANTTDCVPLAHVLPAIEHDLGPHSSPTALETFEKAYTHHALPANISDTQRREIHKTKKGGKNTVLLCVGTFWMPPKDICRVTAVRRHEFTESHLIRHTNPQQSAVNRGHGRSAVSKDTSGRQGLHILMHSVERGPMELLTRRVTLLVSSNLCVPLRHSVTRRSTRASLSFVARRCRCNQFSHPLDSLTSASCAVFVGIGAGCTVPGSLRRMWHWLWCDAPWACAAGGSRIHSADGSWLRVLTP